MASAAVAIRPSVSTLEPFRHVPGTPAKQAVELANAHHEGRFKKLLDQANQLQRHLSDTHQNVVEIATKNGMTKKMVASAALMTGVTGTTALTLGVVDKRFGGARGYANLAGVPVDGLVTALGLGGAALTAIFADHPYIAQALLAVGHGGLGAMGLRFGGEIGTAWLERSQQHGASAVAANGARPGALYTVAPPPKV